MRLADTLRFSSAGFAAAAGLVLGPAAAAAWNWGGGEAYADQWPVVASAWRILEPRGLLGPDRGHSTMAWDALHALAMLFLLPTLWAYRARRRREVLPTERLNWIIALTGAATVLMFTAYASVFGFPLDLLAFFAAGVLTFLLGLRELRRPGGDAWLGWCLTVGLVAALGLAFWWMMGYVPGFLALGLALTWAVVGIRSMREETSGPATQGSAGPTAGSAKDPPAATKDPTAATKDPIAATKDPTAATRDAMAATMDR